MKRSHDFLLDCMPVELLDHSVPTNNVCMGDNIFMCVMLVYDACVCSVAVGVKSVGA